MKTKKLGAAAIVGTLLAIAAHSPSIAAVETVDHIEVTADNKSPGSLAQGRVASDDMLTVKNDVSVSGANSKGVRTVGDNATVVIEGDVNVSGARSYGVVTQSANADITVGGKVSLSGEMAYGLHASNGSNVKIGDGVIVSSNSVLDGSTVRIPYGVSLNGGSAGKISGDILITGDGARGVYVTSSTLELEGGVSVSGNYRDGLDSSFGVVLRNGSSADITGDIDASGERARGVQLNAQTDAESANSLNFSGNISASGKDAIGLNAGAGSSVRINSGYIIASGDGAIGANGLPDANNIQPGPDIKANVDVVEALGNAAQGIAVRGGYLEYSGTQGRGSVLASGENSYGISLRNGSSADIEADIVASNNGAKGLFVTVGSDVRLNGSVEANAGGATGVTMSDSTGDIRGNLYVSGAAAAAAGGGELLAYGLSASRSDVVMSGDISVSGNGARGVSMGEGKLDLTGSVYVTGGRSDGGLSAYGMTIRNESLVDMKGDLVVSGDHGIGINMIAQSGSEAGSGVKLSGTAAALGENSRGFNAGIGNDIEMTEGGLLAAGKGSYGAYITGSSLKLDGAVSASGEGAYGAALFAGSSADISGSVSASGAGSRGLQLKASSAGLSGDITASGRDAAGVYILDNGELRHTGQIAAKDGGTGILLESGTFTTDGRIFAQDNGTGTSILGGTGTLKNIHVEGANAVGASVRGSGVMNAADGRITVSGTDAVGIELNNGGTANLSGMYLSASGNNLLAKSDSFGSLNVSGGSSLRGDILHEGTDAGTLDVQLSGGSYLIGTVNALGGGAVDVTLKGGSDLWEVTGDSHIKGRLENHGVIDLIGADAATSSHKMLTFGSYEASEGAVIRKKADLTNQAGDYTRIEGEAKGVTSLYVANTSQGSTYNDRSHILVTAVDYEAQGSDADFTLANPDHYVDVGGRKYTLADEYSGSDRNWFLQSDGLAPSGKALAGVSVIMPEIWYLEVDTLYKRIESYGTPGYEGGFWFNGAAKKIEHNAQGSFGDQEQKLYTMSVGWDTKDETSDGALFRGFMTGYGYDQRSFSSGRGESDMHSFQASFYGIKRRTDGLYYGGLVKYNRYNSSASAAINGTSEKIKSDFEQNGLGASLIAGKRFSMRNGWYWEPTAQLSYLRVFGKDIVTTSGLRASIDDGDSLRGKLGVVLGRKWVMRSGRSLDIFFDASVVHEFDGETKITMENEDFTSDYGGTWGVFGIGTAWQLSKNSWLNARFYYADGDSRREPWGVQLGMSIAM